MKINLESYKAVKVKDKSFKGLPEPWNLSWLKSRNWGAKNRVSVLIVLESVFSPDLSPANKNHVLLGAPKSREFISNVLNAAAKRAVRLGAKSNWEFAFVNFNHMPWFALGSDKRASAKRVAAKRIESIVKKLEPDRIIVMGDGAALEMTGDPNVKYRRGREEKYKGVPMFTGLDLNLRILSAKEGSADSDLSVGEINRMNLLGYTVENMANGLLGKNPFDLSKLKANPKLVESEKDLDVMLSELRKAKRIAFDTETTSLSPFTDILTAQFAVSEDRGWVLPITHQDCRLSSKTLERARKELRSLFGKKRDWGDHRTFVVGQNAGFDMRVLSNWMGLKYWYMPIWDTQAGEYLLDENIAALKLFGTPAYNLTQIATKYGNDFYKKSDFSKKHRLLLAKKSLAGAVLNYCAMDVQILLGIQRMQTERAEKIPHNQGDYLSTYRHTMLTHMSTMVRVLSTMIHRGIVLNMEWLIHLKSSDSPLEKLRRETLTDLRKTRELIKTEQRLRRRNKLPERSLMTAEDSNVFDLGKQTHKKTLFMDVMGLEPLRLSKKKKEPAFDKAFLAQYGHLAPVALAQRLTELKTLQNTYVDSYLKRQENSNDVGIDGRIRPEYGYTATITGRSNSKNPNLQNTPNHGQHAKHIKRLMTTPPMSLGWEADFSAHEVRCWMLLSRDANLLRLFQNMSDIIRRHRRKQTKKTLEDMRVSADLHRLNYAMFNGGTAADVTAEQRQDAKGIVFGTVYGMSEKSLGVTIGKSAKQAAVVQQKFFDTYKDAANWLSAVEKSTARDLYITTPLGRRRNMPGYMVPDGRARKALDRRARNSPIQGIASDFTIIAADLYHRKLNECMEKLIRAGLAPKPEKIPKPEKNKCDLAYLPYGLNNTVHDSLKGESHFDLFFLSLELIEWAMTDGLKEFIEKTYPMEIPAPFLIEMEIGSDWAHKEKWDWRDKTLDAITLRSLANHKKIYSSIPEIAKMEPEKTLARMKRMHRKQCGVVKLDNRRSR